jgi:hypothetical protein
MEIKLICNDDDVVISTSVNVEHLETEENLKKVFIAFIKFLDKSGAVFPEELEAIMQEFGI